MARYGLATLLDDCPVGYEFTSVNIPLHLTHVDSFEIELGVSELEERLQQLCADQKPIAVRALADELWGPNKDIPVTTLELTPDFAVLHGSIMDMLHTERAMLKNPQYHREGYGPHVSVYGARRVPIGKMVIIKDISIGAKLSDDENATYRILATVPFITQRR